LQEGKKRAPISLPGGEKWIRGKGEGSKLATLCRSIVAEGEEKEGREKDLLRKRVTGLVRFTMRGREGKGIREKDSALSRR